ncbi:MAG: hypothetical protein JWM00_120 [Candidatus Saccharibacteria bacterium]|nr:hypothetical protein [Candidatus Saccharibacteria bacterium]
MKIVASLVRFTPAIAVMAVIACNVLLVAPSFAADLTIQGGANSAQGTDQTSDLFGSSGIFKTITNTLLFVLGAISVIMIIVGGLRYVVSGGDSSAVNAAKNTILYAVVGVIVAILAYAIINFVISSFTNGSGLSGGGSV